MGGAMLKRWLDLGLCDEVAVVDPSASSLESKEVTWGPRPPEVFTPDAIVFAVKPQTLPDILPLYAPYARSGALFVSIAAGRTISFFQNHLGVDARIVRAMPNLPASIGHGVTAAVATPNLSPADGAKAAALLSAVGRLIWLDDETLIDPVTALSGSGPAYVFFLTEVLEKAGTSLGLSPAVARDLARLTVEGSAALMEREKELSPATLRENVTSPGGTTRAALDVLMKEDALQKLFDEALAAAARRGRELSD